MAQAKILTQEELARVLAHIARRPHAARRWRTRVRRCCCR